MSGENFLRECMLELSVGDQVQIAGRWERIDSKPGQLYDFIYRSERLDAIRMSRKVGREDYTIEIRRAK